MKPKKENINSYIRLCLFIIIFLSGEILVAQPVANFTATPVSGCVPLTVSFRDNSTGNPTAWNWNLGNGAISGQQNPSTTFFTPGIYNITLTVSNASGSNSITKNQYITVYDKPTVNFTVSDSSTCIPVNVKFTDLSKTSIGSITNWKWDFDDGSFSSVQNPQHLYNTAGNYNITLKVTNTGGCINTLTKLAYIKATDSIRTLFSFTKGIKCNPPETIAFTNNTTGPGTLSFLWNFGDGNTSTTATPNHTYLSGGLFSVKLIVKNNLGCKDTVLLKDTLLIKDVQSKINGPDTVCNNTIITFTNSTTPPPLSAAWYFDDGSFAFGSSVSKRWTTAGIYSLKLVNNYSTCSDSAIKKITVRSFPFVNFKSNDSSSCKAPLTVNFTDLSFKPTSWLWRFGDGGTSTLQNPTYTYLNNGLYNVDLTITDSFGCKGFLVRYPFIEIGKPAVDIDTREGGGCIPYPFSPRPVITSIDGIASYLWDFGNGSTSTNPYPTETYTAIGSYTIKLTVTTNDGCIDSAVIVNGVKTGTPPVVNFNASPTSTCPGNNIQFSDLSAPADKWQWFFGDGNTSTDQNPLHLYFDTGRFSIKLIAWNNGCSDSILKSRIISILPGVARFREFYNCINKKEVLFKDSSIVPQNWLWDFGDGTTSTAQNPLHLFANYQNYIVSLTVSNGLCSTKKIKLISLFNEVPDFTVPRDSFCKSDTVVFYFKNFKKTNISNYIWDYGDGMSDTTTLDSMVHRYLLPGRYTVKLTIRDLHGCIETVIKPNFIHVFGPKAGFTINAPGGCLNQVVNFTDTSTTESGRNNIAEWKWNFGDGQSQNFIAPSPSPVPHIYTTAGSYYPFLKITDSVGCSDSIVYSTPLKINKPFAVFYSPNNNTCINDTIIWSNSSTGTNLTYQWSFGDGSFSNVRIPLKQYTAHGDYTVKLIVTDVFGCQDSMIKINYIKVRDVKASFTISDSIGTCIPFQVNFTNTSVNAIWQKWDFGDGGFSTTVNPVYYYTAPGIYFAKLTVKRSNYCVSTYTKKIEVTSPFASLTYSPLDGCAPLNVIFHVTTRDNVSYLWDFNDGTSFFSADSNTTHNYILPGSFVPKVVLKDSAGCIVPIIGLDTVRLYSSKVNFTALDSILCDSATVSFLDSTISGSAVNGYRWNFGDGGSSWQQNPSHLYSNPGFYNIGLVISTIYGCQDSLIKNNFIKVVKKPAINISGITSYCGASPVLLQGNLLSIDTSAIFWKWDFSNGNFSSLQNPLPQQYNDTGSYAVKLIAVNSSGCTDTANIQVVIKALPNTFAGNDTTICLNTAAQLLATGADFYEWRPTTFLSCINCPSPSASPTYNYTYFVKGTTVAGCEKTDSVFIRVKNSFRISGLQPIDSLCAGKNIQLNVKGAENYIWTPADGINNNGIANPLIKPAKSNTYKVVGFDSSNCFKDSALIFIKVNDNPAVNAGPDKIVNAGSNITLSPQYTGNITNWLWQPATSLNCSDCPDPIATLSNDIIYSIKVTTVSGCESSDKIFIKVICDNNNLFLPNAFTPNNDPYQLNEVFYPRGTGVFKIAALKIYDRFGKLVFSNGNFYPNDRNAGWNGLYKGKPSPVGNYIYTIEFICSNNETVNLKGNILLLR